MRTIARIGLVTALALMLAAPVMAGKSSNDRFIDVIVSVKEGDSLKSHFEKRNFAGAVAADHDLTPTHTYGTVFSGFAARVPEARLEALHNDPVVESVSLDGTAHTMQSCNAPHTDPCDGGGDDGGGQTLPWGVDRVDADANNNTGAGTHVYVIDTGIDADHGDLQANLGNGFAAVNCKGGGCDADWDDDHGHGTHVAGTVGAIDNDLDVVGVAPDVTLHAVKVLDKRGSGSFSDIIAGIDWVAGEVQNRGEVGVANMSLGGSGSKSGSCDSSGFTGDDNFHKAICNATNDGVVFAVAAGNDGADAENSTPAAYDDSVITVSATNDSDDWTSWSNWGDNAADWDNDEGQHAPVAIAAPGADILSTQAGGGTTTMSGTSMASPHVAGGAALYVTSNAQSLDYTAFTNTRDGLLAADESTDGFSNTSGNPHDEDFLDAESL
jgi:subtilisin